MAKENAIETAKSIFSDQGGPLRTSEAIAKGIHPRTLYAMRDAGIIERLSRGVYRLADLQPLGNPDLVSVVLRVPDCVICLISALAFHEMTMQVPHAVYIAVPRGTWHPDLDYPPVRVFSFHDATFPEGIEIHEIDGVKVRVYSPEKTLADCFKHRNKIGIDVAVEALKLYRKHKPLRAEKLIRYARICRVDKVMRPYLEAIL